MRILVLSNVVPHPPHSGLQLRILHLLRRVARRHEVTLVCHARSAAEEEQARELTAAGIRTFTGRLTPQVDLVKIAWAARFAISLRPPELALYRSAELSAILRELFRKETFDVVHVEEPVLAPYADLLPAASAARKLLTFIDLRWVQSARTAPLEASAGMRAWRSFNSRNMRRYEPRVARAFGRCITVTAHDRQLLLEADPRLKVDVIPNGVDTTELRPLPEHPGPPSILFIGAMFYKPCEDGAVWLVREILPLVRRVIPELETWIVGRGPGPEVETLAGERIFVTGEVDRVEPYYARASLAIAPLRAGSGSRLKILEAMALGRAIVSTTVGAEGLDAVPGLHLELADHPEDFAQRIVDLIRNRERRRRIAAEARSFVEQNHDWDPIAARQIAIYEELAAS